MGGVEAHATLLLDELFDPHGGPQTRGVSQGLRSSFESALDPPQVRWPQTRLAPRTGRFLQAGATRLGQLPGPPTHRLAMDADFPRHLRLARPFLEQSHRLHASFLQRVEISSDTLRISHALSILGVTILCKSQ